MAVFADALVAEFNKRNENKIVYKCPCYEDYKNFEKVDSYMACILANNAHNKVYHKCMPIMFGSQIDKSIRKPSARDYLVQGSFFLNERSKSLYTFMTQKTTGIYHYQTKNDKYIGIRTDKFIVKYRKTLPVKHKNSEHYQNNLKKIMVQTINQNFELKDTENVDYSDIWVDELNKKNIFGYTFSEDDYLDYLTDKFDTPFNLDELAHKVLISPANILHKVYLERHTSTNLSPSAIVSAEKKLNESIIRELMLTGNFYFALSQIATNNLRNENYLNMFQVNEAHKQDAICFYASHCRRAISKNMKGTKALFYAPDGENYLDMATIKELNDSGETIAFCDLAIITYPTDPLKVHDWIKNRQCYYTAETRGYIVVIGTSLTKILLARDDFIALKREFPMINCFWEGKYIYINTDGENITRFSPTYNIFISPSEVRQFKKPFDDYAFQLKFSSLFRQLTNHLCDLSPAKAVVSGHGKRGLCFVENGGDFLDTLYHKSVGFNSSLVKGNCDLTQYAIVGKTDKIPPIFQKINFLQDYTEQRGFSINDLVGQKDLAKYYELFNDTVYKVDRYFYFDDKNKHLGLTVRDYHAHAMPHVNLDHLPNEITYKLIKVKRGVVRVSDNFSTVSDQESKIICQGDTYINDHTLMWATFGDFSGFSNEDGIIIDGTVIPHYPKRRINIKTTVLCRPYDVNTKFDSIKIYFIKEGLQHKNFISVGSIKSNVRLSLKQNSNLEFQEIDFKSSFEYRITISDFTGQEKKIETDFNEKTGLLFIQYSYESQLSIGTKINNKHGQKNLVSKLLTPEERNFLPTFVTKDGTCIKPQVIFPIQSIPGRLIASQILTMCQDVAFTPDGQICGKLSFGDHNKSPNTSCKICTPKNDLWTSECGFHANGMHTFTQQMKRKRYTNNIETLNQLYFNMCHVNKKIDID